MAADTPDQEYGFTIDGKIYPEPETLTIDDHRIIKRYTGFNFRELASMSPDALYVDQDGIAAILHISYRHVHEDMTFDEIEEIIGKQNLDAAQATLEASSGEVPLDPESTPTPDESSPRSIASTTKPSGTGSRESSESSDDPPGATGTPESGTSSPELAQALEAV